ncbi:Cof-type HAD-IIB family hydrolase [Lactiplantibacillus daowaiensis]|uniref:Cof-type HAD-IIB family hydrolase n=2 Tax=Lactiplantibacillus daowaiensis TaxID=2559918 RepID=A0ABW1S195_9LACO
MYQAIVAFDLDATLLNQAKQIPTENLQALVSLRANQILPVIATGRDRFEIQDIIQAGQFDAIVSANGADVYFQDQQLFEDTLAPTVLNHLATWSEQQQVSLAVSNHDGMAISQIDDLVRLNYRRIHRELPQVDASYYQNRDISKALTFIADTPAGRQQEAQLRETFSDLTFYRNSDVCIDVVATGTTKASGIATLQAKAGFETLPVYTFGDGYNDISMLKAANVGIAMGNAPVAVQQQADYVTRRYDDNGIVDACQHFNLI